MLRQVHAIRTDALRHVNVVARRSPTPVSASLSINRDRLRRADRLAQFASDAALLAGGVPPQRMLAAEARRERTLLERVVQLREVARVRRVVVERVSEQPQQVGLAKRGVGG